MTRNNQARRDTDKWSLFLRQRRLQDQLRRLGNDFKSCHCPPGCRGGPHNHAAADPASLPEQDLHGPYVAVDGDMPKTSGRPEVRANPEYVVLAEARGASDILLRRDTTRATLRMSLQVHTDPDQPGRRGYFAEMFLTQRGRQERFIGLIESWHVDRSTRDWEALYLTPVGWDDTDLAAMRLFIRESYGYGSSENIMRDQAGNVIPKATVQRYVGARWSRLTGDTDFIFVPLVWVHESVCTCIINKQHFPPLSYPLLPTAYTCNNCRGILIRLEFKVSGNRIIDQALELFYRLVIGGTLPAREFHGSLYRVIYLQVLINNANYSRGSI